MVAITIQLLIVMSVITIALETVPGLPAWTNTFFFYEEAIIGDIFLTEYILRTYSADAAEVPVQLLWHHRLCRHRALLLLLGLDIRSIRRSGWCGCCGC